MISILAILAKVNPVARPEINAIFRHALANRFEVGRIALFHSVQRRDHLGRGDGIKPRKPLGVRGGTIGFEILGDLPCRHA